MRLAAGSRGEPEAVQPLRQGWLLPKRTCTGGKDSLRPGTSHPILHHLSFRSWHSTGSSRDFHLRQTESPNGPRRLPQRGCPDPGSPSRSPDLQEAEPPRALAPRSGALEAASRPPAREGCRWPPRRPSRPPARQPAAGSAGAAPGAILWRRRRGARAAGSYLHNLALRAERGPGPREAAREAGGVGGVVAARARLEQHHLHERRLLGPRRAGPRGRQQQPEQQRQRRRRRQAAAAGAAGAAAEAAAAAARGPWAPARARPHGPAAGGRGGRARPGIVAGRRRTERGRTPHSPIAAAAAAALWVAGSARLPRASRRGPFICST